MIKVMTNVVTLPEIIRLSRVMARLNETADDVLMHTGQNYDYELNRLACLVEVREKWGLPIYVSTHPRTRKRLEEALPDWTEPEGIVFHEPFGFHDFNRLQLSAACVLSDSGTIAEESTILGFPAITLRDSIERPEALDTGGIVMTDLDAHDVVEAVTVATKARRPEHGVSTVTPGDYLIENTSVRAVNFILSTSRRHKSWAGIR
ncbi:MAG TPA: UDP-N-acetylglucosamine 2-epimerase [Dermatophilaceae bacterium]